MAKNAQGNDLLEQASFVAQLVQIEDVRLIGTRAHRDFDTDEPPPKVEFGFNAETDFDVVAQQIKCWVSFAFDSYFDVEEKPASAPLHIDVGFQLTYSLRTLEGIDDEKVEAFGKMNGVYNAWPYIREFVQSTLVRMGLPSLTLPVLTSGILQSTYESEKTSAHSELSTEETI